MRWGFHLMSVACCGVLASIMWSRGQTWWAVGMAAIALAYLVRGILGRRAARQEHLTRVAADMSQPKSAAQQREILADLLSMRDRLRMSRNIQILAGIALIGIVAMLHPTNPPLALAMLVLLIPLGVMIHRGTRKILTIDNGLKERNLIP